VRKRVQEKIIERAIYYYRVFLTWKGKRIYLERSYVKNPKELRVAGKLLLIGLWQRFLKKVGTGMNVQSMGLENEPAIIFLQKILQAYPRRRLAECASFRTMTQTLLQ